MTYWVTVSSRSLVPSREGRVLAPPRGIDRIRDARAWLARNAATWIDALLPTECGFIGLVIDGDGEPARAIEYGLDPDAPPIDHDRAALTLMRGAS